MSIFNRSNLQLMQITLFDKYFNSFEMKPQSILFLLALIFTFSFQIALGQEDPVWSPIIESENRYGNEALGTVDGYYFLEIDSRIRQYDENHELVKDFGLYRDLEGGYRAWSPTRLFNTTKGSYLLFCGVSEQKSALFCSKYEDGEFRAPKMIKEFDHKIGGSKSHYPIDYPFKDIFGAFDRNWVLSEDGTKIAFVSTLKDGSKKLSAHDVYACVFDTDLKELWNKKITLDYENKDFLIGDVKVNNLGEVFILSWTKDSNKNPSELKMRKLSSESSINYVIDFASQNACPRGAEFTFDKNNSPVIMGLYANLKNKFISGTYIADATSEFKPRLESLETFITENFDVKKGILKGSLPVKNVLRFDNGKIGFVAERGSLVMSDNGAVSTVELLIVIYNASGEIDGKYVLDKELVHSPGHSSFHFFQAKDRAVFVYMENWETVVKSISSDGSIELEKKLPRKPYRLKDSLSFSYTACANGEDEILIGCYRFNRGMDNLKRVMAFAFHVYEVD